MKKLMIAAAIVCAAAFAQAALIDWGVVGGAIPDYAGSGVIEGQEVYFYAFVDATAQAAFYDNLKGGKTNFADAKDLALDHATGGTGSKTANQVVTREGIDLGAAYEAGEYYQFSAIVYDDVNNRFIMGNLEMDAYDPATEFSDNTEASFGSSEFSKTHESATGWTTAASVPEPTSGLLLLLGVAGLALRRRRA